MTGLVAGLVGLVVGGTAAGSLTALVTRRRRCVDPTAHELTDQDRETVAAEFAVHATAVRRGVSEYADTLAGGDTELRDRLRRFERGER